MQNRVADAPPCFRFCVTSAVDSPGAKGYFRPNPDRPDPKYHAGQVTHAHAERYPLYLSELF
jgi:hypothetical protein